MTKYIHNLNTSKIIVMGIEIPAESYWQIPNERIIMFASCSKLQDLINSDDVLMSKNGSQDLSKADSLLFAQIVVAADKVYYDNDNSTALQNAQDQVENISAGQITIKEDGTNVTNTPHTKINFTGSGVDVTDDGNDQVSVTISGAQTVFGTQFNEVSSEIESQTTNNIYKEKLTMALTSLPSGKYRIGWYFEIKISSASASAKAKVELDDATILMETKDAFKHLGYAPISGISYQNLSNDHDIDIDFCTDSKGKTATIRRARLEVWRVS